MYYCDNWNHYLFWTKGNDKLLSSSVEVKPLIFKKDTLYFKIKNWGMSGDNIIIELSNDKVVDIDGVQKAGFLYKQTPLLYSIKDDTLTIFCYKKSDSVQLSPNVTIIQKQISNPEMMNLLDSLKEKNIVLLK